MTRSQAFGKSSRLLNASDYSNVFQNTCHRVSTKHFLLLAADNEGLGVRLGLIVAKKHVRLAVDRNRIKRLIRESFRKHHFPLEKTDLIVLARPHCASLSNAECTKTINHLLTKLAKKSKAR